MPDDLRQVFLSHSSRDSELTRTVRDGLTGHGFSLVVDPFEPGERTCLKAQQSIKACTHFVLLLTPHAAKSRWVGLETLFAQLCHSRGAIECIPVCLDGTEPLEPIKELIYIPWSSSGDLSDLVSRLASRIAATIPSVRLHIDATESEELKETGRKLECRAASDGDDSILRQAEATYENAIQLNFCNHNAWANLAWVLWKLREDQRAWGCVRRASEINPESNHVKDVRKRMEDGRRII